MSRSIPIELTRPGSHPYPAVGRCVYCGTLVYDPAEPARKLSTEHIVPIGLGGNLLLPLASCRSCAEITSSIERAVQRRVFGPLRIHLGMPTRRPNDRPETLPVTARFSDGSEAILEVPISEHPLICSLFEMSPPRILSAPTDGDRKIFVTFPGGWELADRQLKTLATKVHASEVTIESAPASGEFKIMLAKIAHCLTIAWFGFGGFSPFLPEFIRRRDFQALDLYVGASQEPALEQPCAHWIEARYVRRGRQKLIVVKLSLFGFLGFPSYEVVSGRLFGNFPVVPKADSFFESERIVLTSPSE